VDPTAAVQYTSSSYQNWWYDYVCDPSGCTYVQRYYGQVNENWQVPVDVRFAAFHGNGSMSMYRTSCSGDCPPWFYSYGSSTSMPAS
jgi:hypothetical protein